jgi:signal transduction histidine kinase
MTGLANRLLYLAILLLTAVGIWIVFSRHAAEVEQAKQSLQTQLRSRAISLDQEVQDMRQTVTALSRELSSYPHDLSSDEGAAMLRMALLTRGTSDIGGLLLVHRGQVVCAPKEKADCNRWLGEGLKALLSSPANGWHGPLVTAEGQAILSYSEGVGEVRVAAIVPLASLKRFTIPIGAAESVITLADPAGHVLVDGDDRWAAGSSFPALSVGPALALMQTGVVAWQDSYLALDRIEETGGVLVAEIPQTAIQAEADKAIAGVRRIVISALLAVWIGMAALEVAVLRPARTAAKRLAETLQTLEITFAAVGDGIALFDDDNRLLARNDHFVHLMGADGAPIHRGDPLPARFCRDALAPAPDDGTTRVFEFANGDGSWIEARLRHWDADGRAVQAMILTDVSERRQATERAEAARRQAEDALERLRQTQAQLIESEKLAALGSLVAGIAHEINTPIGVAMGAATSLAEITRHFLRSIEQGAIRRSTIDSYSTTMTEAVILLERNLARASDLITHFKQVAVDQTSMQRRRFDLRDVVGETVTTLYPAFKRTPFTVQVDIPKDIILDSYPGPLGQIVTNMLTNALTHAFAGRDSGSIVLTGVATATHATLICRDDGTGMPAEVAKRVFEPFFTTRRSSGGSGLGMHIVYSLVTGVLGGDIGIESAPDSGTTIRITVPLVAPDGDIDRGTGDSGDRKGRQDV